jgi:hypothetical protein
VSHDHARQEVLRLALEFRVDVKYWKKEVLSAAEQVDERCKAMPYILKTIEMLHVLGGRTVVEIGSMRQALSRECLAALATDIHAVRSPGCCTDGHSTYFWARAGFTTHTVDVDPNCRDQLALAYRNLDEPFPENLKVCVPCDGIEFLREFAGSIDLLFLDGWDKGTLGYAEHHLEAYVAARPKLARRHLISVDDTDFDTAEGGKDHLLAPQLIADGYVPIIKGRQTVFLPPS